MHCFFVSDLHGRTKRYETLWSRIAADAPELVLLGGDLLPRGAPAGDPSGTGERGFLRGFLADGFRRLAGSMGTSYPLVAIILGNDDARAAEPAVLELAESGIWSYAHQRSVAAGRITVYGYANVPPTPFPNKDWERYDVSRYVDPGCLAPEEGYRTAPITQAELQHSSIRRDLEELAGTAALSNAIMLFHSPPYETALDRAALDGRTVDHVPLDVHVGSIAIRRFIEDRQPLVTLHGHVHESARLTGRWHDRIGRTHMLGAAHDGPELALVQFDTDALDDARRELI